MASFNSIDLKYTPLAITNSQLEEFASAPSSESENIAIVDKLLQHLNLIKEYSDRIDAIDYLSSNAVKLTGEISYTAKTKKLISNIKELGGSGSEIDFVLFQKAIDIVINGYKEMALASLTGVNND